MNEESIEPLRFFGEDRGRASIDRFDPLGLALGLVDGCVSRRIHDKHGSQRAQRLADRIGVAEIELHCGRAP